MLCYLHTKISTLFSYLLKDDYVFGEQEVLIGELLANLLVIDY